MKRLGKQHYNKVSWAVPQPRWSLEGNRVEKIWGEGRFFAYAFRPCFFFSGGNIYTYIYTLSQNAMASVLHDKKSAFMSIPASEKRN